MGRDQGGFNLLVLDFFFSVVADDYVQAILKEKCEFYQAILYTYCPSQNAGKQPCVSYIFLSRFGFLEWKHIIVASNAAQAAKSNWDNLAFHHLGVRNLLP